MNSQKKNQIENMLNHFGQIKYKKIASSATTKKIYLSQPSGAVKAEEHRLVSGHLNWFEKKIQKPIEEKEIVRQPAIISIPNQNVNSVNVEAIIDHYITSNFFFPYLMTKNGLLKIENTADFLKNIHDVVAMKKETIDEYAVLAGLSLDYILMNYYLLCNIVRNTAQAYFLDFLDPSHKFNLIYLDHFNLSSDEEFRLFLETCEDRDVGLVIRPMQDNIFVRLSSFFERFIDVVYLTISNKKLDAAIINRVLTERKIQYLLCPSQYFLSNDPGHQVDFSKLNSLISLKLFDGDKHDVLNNELLKRIHTYCPKLQYLEIKYLEMKLDLNMNQGIIFHHLKNFQFYDSVERNQTIYFDWFVFLFPNLEYLAVASPNKMTTVNRFHLENLRCLNITDVLRMTNKHFVDKKLLDALLQNHSNLEKFILDIGKLDHEDFPPSSGDFYPKLKHVYISMAYDNPETPMPYLSRLPSVEYLYLNLIEIAGNCPPIIRSDSSKQELHLGELLNIEQYDSFFFRMFNQEKRSRIKKLTVDELVYDSTDLKQLMEWFPNLEELSVQKEVQNMVHDNLNLDKIKKLTFLVKDNVSNILLCAPNIEELTLHKCSDFTNVNAPEGSWPNLKKVHIVSNELNNYIPFLRKVNFIEHLTFTSSSYFFDFSSPTPYISLPNLTHFQYIINTKNVDIESYWISETSSFEVCIELNIKLRRGQEIISCLVTLLRIQLSKGAQVDLCEYDKNSKLTSYYSHVCGQPVARKEWKPLYAPNSQQTPSANQRVILPGKKSIQLDADTECRAKTLTATQQFLPKPFPSVADDVGFYRSSVQTDVQPEQENILQVTNVPFVSFEAIQREYKQFYFFHNQVFFAMDEIYSELEPYLCGLSRYEKIFKIAVSHPTVTLHYNKDRNQYLIRSTQPIHQPITVYYLLQVTARYSLQNLLNAFNNELNPFQKERVRRDVEFIYSNWNVFNNQFGGKKLMGLPPNPSQEQILDAALLQKQGPCTIRALGFQKYAKAHQTSYLESQIIKAHVSSNDVHAYDEFFILNMNTWYTIDPGGYPSQLQIQPFSSLRNKEGPQEMLEWEAEEKARMKKTIQLHPGTVSFHQMKKNIQRNRFYSVLHDDIAKMKKTSVFFDFLCRPNVIRKKADYLIQFDSQTQLQQFNEQLIIYFGLQNREYLILDQLQDCTPYTPHFNKSRKHAGQTDSNHLLKLKNMKAGDVLITPWEDFALMYPGIFNEKRTWLHVKFHEKIIRIGTILKTDYNEKKNIQFISNYFDRTIAFPCTEYDLKLPAQQEVLHQTDAVIDVTNEDELKIKCFGKIEINGTELALSATPFTQTFPAENVTFLVRENHQNETLSLFLTMMKSKKNHMFYIQGEVYSITNLHVRIQTVVPPVLPKRKVFLYHPSVSVDVILNSETFKHFFYLLKINRGMFKSSGLIHAFQGRRMVCLVTERTSRSDLEEIWSEAEKQKCDVQFYFKNSSIVPVECELELFTASSSSSSSASSSTTPEQFCLPIKNKIQLIQSNDPDFTMEMIKQQKDRSYADFIVTETTTISSLIEFIRNENKKDQPFSLDKLHHENGGMTIELLKGINIILFGVFSEEFMRGLESVLTVFPYLPIAGKIEPITVSFLLVHRNAIDCPLGVRQEHQVSIDDYWPILNKLYDPKYVSDLKNMFFEFRQNFPKVEFSYIQFKGMTDDLSKGYHRSNPFKPYLLQKSRSSDLFWQSRTKFRTLPPKPFARIRDDYYFLRTMKEYLERYGFGFGIGESGTGKTVQITEKLIPFLWKEFGIKAKLYSFDQIDKAYDDQETGIHWRIIFPDETNLLSKENANQLLGFLYNNGMVFKNRRFLRRADIKIAGVGNYNDYAGREILEVLERHGLTFEVKKEQMEDPNKRLRRKFKESYTDLQLQNPFDEYQLNAFIEILFNHMDFFPKENYPCLVNERNWNYLLLLVLYHVQHHTVSATTELSEQMQTIIQLALYDAFNAESYRKTQRNFLMKNPNLFFITSSKLNALKEQYCVMESRKEIVRSIYLHSEIQKMCTNHPGITIRPPIGIVLSGKPGTGRSSLLKLWSEVMDQKSYHVITPTDDVERYEQELNACFQAGKTVVIHNLSRLPKEIQAILEPVNNAFLCGMNMTFQFLKQWNFRVFFIEDSGEAFSIAMTNRVISLDFTEFTEQETVEMLKSWRVPDQEAKNISTDFYEMKKYAKLVDQVPPSMDDLKEKAEESLGRNGGMKRTLNGI